MIERNRTMDKKKTRVGARETVANDHDKYRGLSSVCQPLPLTKLEMDVWNAVEEHDKRWGVFYVAQYLRLNHGTVSRIVRKFVELGLFHVGDRRRTGGRGRPFRPLYANRKEFAAYQKAVATHENKHENRDRQDPPVKRGTHDGTVQPCTGTVYENKPDSETGSIAHPERETAPASDPSYISREDLRHSSLSGISESVSKSTTTAACAEEKSEEGMRGRPDVQGIKAWTLEEGIKGDPNGSPINWIIARRSITRLHAQGYGLEDFRVAWVGYTDQEWTDFPTWSGLIADFDAWVEAGREVEVQEAEDRERRERYRKAQEEYNRNLEAIQDLPAESEPPPPPPETEEQRTAAEIAELEQRIARCPEPVAIPAGVSAAVQRGYRETNEKRTRERQALEELIAAKRAELESQAPPKSPPSRDISERKQDFESVTTLHQSTPVEVQP